MASIRNKLITKQMPWHANMTELNHLGASLHARPAKMEGKMSQLFSAQNYYSDNPMHSTLIDLGMEKEITSTEWEWELRTATTKPLVVIENVMPVALTQPGKGRAEIRIKLDEDWYREGDVIHPGTTNKKYQCRVQSDPRKHGKGYIYTLRLMDDNINSFLPVQFLRPGQKWGKLYSVYAEGSNKSGSTQYALPITLKNRLSRFRKHYQVTGDAHNEVLAVGIPDSKGMMHKSWMKYAEVEFWMQWYRELERGYWYTRSTDRVTDDTGRPVYTGPGIQEQLEDSHKETYSFLTARLIEEYLMDIFYSRVKPGQQRKIKAYTGEYGMILFHRAIQEWAQRSGFITIVQDISISKTDSPYHTNALQGGYQFTKYKMANGSELELIHNPLYDDRQINFDIDPVTGYPTESMRFTFLDFSGEGKNGNIMRMKRKGGMSLAYVAGLVSPYGPMNNTMASHAGDYYEMHVKDQCGVHIEDVSRCGELILKRN